ncbi:MAG: type II toxin-antitoxin system VapC family toxin [Thermoguttaceae bacterium]
MLARTNPFLVHDNFACTFADDDRYNTVMRTVYVETSVVSYLTSRPSRDVRVAAWQEITAQWWDNERVKYELFTSELVITEAGGGNATAARNRLSQIEAIPVLAIDEAAQELAARLIRDGAVPASSQADALHIAIASVHGLDYLLTWNCRHIDNAATKPLIRSICAVVGYQCPEICTPLELMSEDREDVSG